MKRYLVSITDCVFDAFANENYGDPQEHRQLWAIQEGIDRIESYPSSWREVTARKKHECIRGCEIEDRNVYFQLPTGGGWGTEWKFCAGCVAMILYFKEVEKLPPCFYTHWDEEVQAPVRVEGEPRR